MRIDRLKERLSHDPILLVPRTFASEDFKRYLGITFQTLTRLKTFDKLRMTSDSLQMQLEDQMNQNFSTFVSDVVYKKNLTQMSG